MSAPAKKKPSLKKQSSKDNAAFKQVTMSTNNEAKGVTDDSGFVVVPSCAHPPCVRHPACPHPSCWIPPSCKPSFPPQTCDTQHHHHVCTPYQAVSQTPRLLDDTLTAVPCPCPMMNSHKSISCLSACSPDSKNCELHDYPNTRPIGQAYVPSSNSYQMIHSNACWVGRHDYSSTSTGCGQHAFSSKKYFPAADNTAPSNVPTTDREGRTCTCGVVDPVTVKPCPVHFPIVNRPCSNNSALPYAFHRPAWLRPEPKSPPFLPKQVSPPPFCSRSPPSRIDYIRCRPGPLAAPSPEPIKSISCILAELPSRKRCTYGDKGPAGRWPCPLHNSHAVHGFGPCELSGPPQTCRSPPPWRAPASPCQLDESVFKIKCPRHDISRDYPAHDSRERPCLCGLIDRLKKKPGHDVDVLDSQNCPGFLPSHLWRACDSCKK